MRNAEQILAIITATFGTELFHSADGVDPCIRKDTDIEDLACRWHILSKSAKSMGTSSTMDQEWTTGMSQVRQASSRPKSL